MRFAVVVQLVLVMQACGSSNAPASDSAVGDTSALPPATWTEVHALFRRDCATSSCHGDNARNGQLAQSDSAAAHAAALRFVNTANPTQSSVYRATTATVGRGMPDGRRPEVPWPSAPTLLAWIRAGATNN